jgi:uncharacterized protein (DUF1501 family)
MLRPSGVAFASGFCANVPVVELHLAGEAPDHLLLCPSQSAAAWSTYAASNPNILPTLALPGQQGPRTLLPINGTTEYALRPNLTTFQRAINNQNAAKYSLAAINYVGHDTNRDFGHDTSWARVSAADVTTSAGTVGWAGKLADECYASEPLAVFSLRGRTLTAEGENSKVNIVTDLAALGFDNPRGGTAYARFIGEAFGRMRRADPVLSNVTDRALHSAWDTLQTSASEFLRIVASYNAIPAAQRATYGIDALSQSFMNAARLIRTGSLPRGSIHLSAPGWDVHSKAAEAVESLTTGLNAAIGAFLTDMEMGGHDVILLVWHGFGRNSFQNANTEIDGAGRTIFVPGNDHGHGRVAWVFGKGSRVIAGVHGPSAYRPDDFLNPKTVTGALGWIPGGHITTDRGVAVPGVDFREVLAQVLQQAGADPAIIIPGRFPTSAYNVRIFR